MQILSGLIAGIIFGLGLLVSGMADPAKVLNFLDLFGHWDPSLAFVMAGAIVVSFPGFRLVDKRTHPLFGEAFQLPTKADLDFRLITGAAIFGVGWGIGGFCPGPAIVAIPFAATGTFIFVPAMLVGMWIAKILIVRSTN